MSELTYGELFARYGGLGMGVQSVVGGEMKWCAEFEAAPSKILAHHWPDATNYGDVTKIDWATVPKVDVITGGSPCQDLSHAGKRAGMTTGTRSNLWVEMREAIAVIHPRLVVWENVRGAGSTEADSALEQCPRCVGDPRDGGAVLRALGRVLGDLSDLGYDAWWYGLRAADVGAAHGRFRYFVFAVPADSDLSGLQERGDQGSVSAPQVGAPAAADGDRGKSPHVPGQLVLLKTPTSQLAVNGGSQHPDKRKDGGHGPTLADEVEHLLPARAKGFGVRNLNETAVSELAESQDWAEYEPAIRRQEAMFGRAAPLPTEPGKNGQPRLSPAFVEWLMGLPAGHVTDPAIGISRSEQIKALGNGVVPQQAAAAARAFLFDMSKELTA